MVYFIGKEIYILLVIAILLKYAESACIIPMINVCCRYNLLRKPTKRLQTLPSKDFPLMLNDGRLKDYIVAAIFKFV